MCQDFVRHQSVGVRTPVDSIFIPALGSRLEGVEEINHVHTTLLELEDREVVHLRHLEPQQIPLEVLVGQNHAAG